MSGLTASRLELARRCLGSVVLPQVRGPSTDAQDAGTGRHAFLERAAAVGREQALAEIPADAPWRSTCEALDLAELPAGRYELAFAWDPATDTARELGVSLVRDYQGARDGEITGTADLVCLPTADRPRWLVVDFKGREAVEPAAVNLQLGFYALCVARAQGLDELDVAIAYLGEEGTIRWDYATLGVFDLAGVAAECAMLAARVALALETQRAPTLRTGAHCGRCPALVTCPAQVTLALAVLREVTETPGVDALAQLSDHDAGAALVRLETAAALIGLQVAALRERAKLRGLPLPDGSQLVPVESTRRELVLDKALPVLRSRFGEQVDALVVRSLPVTAVTSLARQLAPGKGQRKTVDALFEELSAAAALKTSTYVQLRARKPTTEAP